MVPGLYGKLKVKHIFKILSNAKSFSALQFKKFYIDKTLK